MTDSNFSTEPSGCARCWPSDADAAWKARSELSHVAMPLDELHYIVSILKCPSCNQKFVSTLSEWVDWVGGDDSQHWTLMPITETEATGLVTEGASLSEAKVAALGPSRRTLRRDYLTGGVPRTYWSGG